MNTLEFSQIMDIKKQQQLKTNLPHPQSGWQLLKGWLLSTSFGNLHSLVVCLMLTKPLYPSLHQSIQRPFWGACAFTCPRATSGSSRPCVHPLGSGTWWSPALRSTRRTTPVCWPWSPWGPSTCVPWPSSSSSLVAGRGPLWTGARSGVGEPVWVWSPPAREGPTPCFSSRMSGTLRIMHLSRVPHRLIEKNAGEYMVLWGRGSCH